MEKKKCSAMNTVVIGGGIVGVCTAYYLLKDGHKVHLIERDSIGGGTTLSMVD